MRFWEQAFSLKDLSTSKFLGCFSFTHCNESAARLLIELEIIGWFLKHAGSDLHSN